MNKGSLLQGVRAVILVAAVSQPSLAATIYASTDHDLNIFASSPPALVFVQDSQNNITGADPSKGLDSFGRGTVIQEIPTSYVEQDNIGSDAINGVSAASSTTSWAIDIMDHPTETFVINLLGVTTGVTQLTVAGLYDTNVPSIKSRVNIIVSSGVTKQIQVTFNPTSQSLTTTPIITGGTFLQDTQEACGLNEISPPEACAVLESLASEAEQAITRGDTPAEASELNLYLLILNRLHDWGQVGSPQDWNDCQGYPECAPLCHIGIGSTVFFAKDPAYSALQLDAATLLNAIPKNGK